MSQDMQTDVVERLADLLAELRPMPTVVATSFVVEALDRHAGITLDAEWSKARARMYPDAVRAAKVAYAGMLRQHIGYAEKRVREVEDARPRPGDHPGGPVPVWDASPRSRHLTLVKEDS